MTNNPSQLQSLGKFLYTQNPFYLISCFLILYGLQVATLSSSDLFSRSIFLTLSIASYTLLMAVTCIGVVRLGKVWEDARSIFLVVVISQVALSSALDELCVSDWSTASGLLAAGGVFTVLITEFVFRACRVRFPGWYRLSLYAFMLVFFGMPVLLGHAVGERSDRLASWGAPIFSSLIALALLVAIPAIRKGSSYVTNNGTPWRWPLFPLSVFVILVVLAGIRTHAIWMSFGFFGASVRFEPFLLFPIALAIFVLVVESEHGKPATGRSYAAMGLAPLLLICGTSNHGSTFLPLRADMQTYFGSAQTIILVALVGFYLYVWLRGLKGSEFAVTATLLALCGFSDLPTAAEAMGFRHWMYALSASMFTLAACLWYPKSDRRWLAFTMISTLAILMAGHTYDQLPQAAMIASLYALVSMMVIGARFKTDLAQVLRQISALGLSIGAIATVIWHIVEEPSSVAIMFLVGLALISILYMQIVRRLEWLYVFAVQVACLLCVLGWNGYQAGSSNQANWSLQSGLVCFLIGLTITGVKTGAHRKLWSQLPKQPQLRGYERGF